MTNNLHNEINLAIQLKPPYLVYMTITQLEKIIHQNTEAAEGGCPKAQGLIVIAQEEIERLRWEWNIRCRELDNQDHAWRSEERNWGVEPEGA